MKLKDVYPMVRNTWRPGQTAYFEYHCLKSVDSKDFPAWQHSHQPAVVIGIEEPGIGRTYLEREESSALRVYRVQFSDGLQWAAFEDELFISPRYFDKKFDPPPEWYGKLKKL